MQAELKGGIEILPDPNRLYELSEKTGETFYFEVTGNGSAPIWGTDVYTFDSALATTAVHAGILKVVRPAW
jgi:hypothetical protein